MSGDAWAPHVEAFVDHHYGSLRGRVRTHVVHEHLLAHLPAPPARVVDVGGGAGTQSIPLADAGYDVTIVDPSAAMLARARAAAGDRVRLVESSGESAVGALDGERFDGVLCHGVVMYVDDPAPLLDSLCSLAAPGGIVSIVAKNRRALAVRPALDGAWEAALAAFDSARQVNGLGIDTRADDPDELAAELVARAVEPVAMYGVRLFTEGWAPDRPPDDPDDVVLAVELEASRRDPYRQMSRLFHLVGVRR